VKNGITTGRTFGKANIGAKLTILSSNNTSQTLTDQIQIISKNGNFFRINTFTKKLHDGNIKTLLFYGDTISKLYCFIDNQSHIILPCLLAHFSNPFPFNN